MKSPTAEAFVNAYTDFGIELTGEACLTGVCTDFGGALIEREVDRRKSSGSIQTKCAILTVLFRGSI